eukprot:1137899-Pelagomonas_calceolata.AAC.3
MGGGSQGREGRGAQWSNLPAPFSPKLANEGLGTLDDPAQCDWGLKDLGPGFDFFLPKCRLHVLVKSI